MCANSVSPVKFYQKHDEIGKSVRKLNHQPLGKIQEILMGAATGVYRFDSTTLHKKAAIL
jgi:hypothetical protein